MLIVKSFKRFAGLNLIEMKKFTEKAKVFVLAQAMAVMLLLPMTTNAQTKMDGFFNSYDVEDFTERTSWEYFVINQQFGNTDTPLGCGLVILTFAGAGYAVLKRKKEE